MAFLRTPEKVSRLFSWIDLVLLVGLIGLFFGLQTLASQWRTEFTPASTISLSWKDLPYYAFLSLSRGVAAYALSFLFTLSYGYMAAHRPWAEKILIPLLDILQSTPVLAFLPGVILGLVALFPHSNTGLELACIFMIFTGQVWNMTFSFYYSLKSIPRELYEVSQVFQQTTWRRFITLELPASTMGLVWNSMVSMAGGWFFLMITEAFVLGDKDFRLPGIGSYMSVAIQQGNKEAMLAAIAVMILMIVSLDNLLWKPLVAWAQKFKLEEQKSEIPVTSTVLRFLRRSRFFSVLAEKIRGVFLHGLAEKRASRPSLPRSPSLLLPLLRKILFFAFLVGVLGAAGFGLFKIYHLLERLTLSDFKIIFFNTFLTFLRVTACVLLGSAWTIPVGVWIGLNPRLAKIFQPLIQVFAFFPAPMIFPLLLGWVYSLGGTIESGSILLMMVGTQWYILFNVIAGTMAIPNDLKEATTLLRMSSWQRWRRLIFPSIFPYLVPGWIAAAGGAWNASIVSEYVNMGQTAAMAPGIGSTITLATFHGNFPLLTGSVLMMALVVVGWNRVIWKKLSLLAQTRYTSA